MPERHTRFDDDHAHELALEHLAQFAGTECASRVCWDIDHHLQGHVDVDGQHLVLIAARDDEHEPLILSEGEWDAVRHGQTSAA